MTWNRRRLLKTALAGSGLLLSRFPARTQDGNALLRAPRQALVIGNSRYSRAPLANSTNDAQGMTEALRGIGPGGLARLAQMELRDEVRRYWQALAKEQPGDAALMALAAN